MCLSHLAIPYDSYFHSFTCFPPHLYNAPDLFTFQAIERAQLMPLDDGTSFTLLYIIYFS